MTLIAQNMAAPVAAAGAARVSRGLTRPFLRPVLTPIALAAGLCAALSAQAQEAAPAPTLAEVTVTGLPLAADDMAAPVSVLEGEVWQLRRGATLGESLAGEPGIQATHFGAGASRPVIRGMDGPRVRVLSDGSQLQDASTVSPDHAVAA